jgi:hypothetical protein
VYSYVKTGNPVFPFANTRFRSKYYDTSAPFSDLRFVAPLSLSTPYDITFRTDGYSEGQGGGTGFQYFLLLIPALLLLRSRDHWLLFAIAIAGTLVIFSVVPYVRYWYPALPLFSIVLAGLLEQGPAARAAFIPLIGPLIGALIGLNFWFWPAAGLYHRDFALFTRQQFAEYLQNGAPQRALIAGLNRRAPGEPVAFLSTDAVAGLEAQAYTDSWHSDAFWGRLKKARTPAEVDEALRSFGVRHIVAPQSATSPYVSVQAFLRRWTEPETDATAGFAVYRLLDAAPEPSAVGPFLPGLWDDEDPRIEYIGAWVRGTFPGALKDSLTYTDQTGDGFRLSFRGTGITYIYTKALNRGFASVSIDGVERARIDLYSAAIEWQSKQTFEGLSPGLHTLEVRALGEKSPRSSGTFIDLDGILIQGAPVASH